jgi:aryl-alcohol dehydrogenase-like predicted oxidoreductase
MLVKGASPMNAMLASAGFLTGAITQPDDLEADDYRRQRPRFHGENFARNLSLVEKVKNLAGQKNVAPSQLALAWVLA